MNIDSMEGPELANHLAIRLSDLEFELLIRERIRRRFMNVHSEYPGLGEHHNQCCFRYRWEDTSEWSVVVGSTYRDEVQLKGEVLSLTLSNAITQYCLQHGNKVSLLLPAPQPLTILDADDETRLEAPSARDDEMPF